MPAKIIVTAKVRVQLQSIVDWYAEQSVLAPDAFIKEIGLFIGKIAKNPERFAIKQDYLRICRLEIFPYYIIYQYYSNSHKVVIQKVVHVKRNPANKFT